LYVQRHGIKLERRGDYRYYLEYLSRSFLSSAALAQRLLGDVRSYLFVSRATRPSRGDQLSHPFELGLRQQQIQANDRCQIPPLGIVWGCKAPEPCQLVLVERQTEPPGQGD
jgi:hypothetical protein